MASVITPELRTLAEYRGIDALFAYSNGDGRLCKTNCGLAAAATLLTYHRKFPADAAQASQIMADLECRHPPDNLGGWFGSSQRRVARICRAFGLRLDVIAGEEALRRHLDHRNPVLVMLEGSAGRFLSFDLPGGHWMLAYGYDREFIYLTNRGRMTWEEFHAGWRGFVTRLIGMRCRGLVAQMPLGV